MRTPCPSPGMSTSAGNAEAGTRYLASLTSPRMTMAPAANEMAGNATRRRLFIRVPMVEGGYGSSSPEAAAFAGQHRGAAPDLASRRSIDRPLFLGLVTRYSLLRPNVFNG